MSETIIKLNNVSKSINKTKILDNFNMCVLKNDIYGFIGENGAGKSTTMKIIVSMMKENSGEVVLFNNHSKNDSYINKGRIGAIIESPAFYPYLNAYENLKYYVIFKGIVDKNSISKVLKMVGLEKTGNKKYKNFSLGMKQRLGLALALLNNPDLLILDEPLNGLDPQGIVELRETLSILNKKYGITILISSHILDELEHIATRYGFIHKGKMIEEISTRDLEKKLRKYILLEVNDVVYATTIIEQELNSTNYEVIENNMIYLYDYVENSEKVLSVLINAGLLIKRMNISNISLEDYYLQLVRGGE